MSDIKCLVCSKEFQNLMDLSWHIRTEHKLSAREYTIQYILKGVPPACPKCGTEPRYTTYAFKTYCRQHSYIAESEGGQKGGTNKIQWNKGQTAADNPIIAQQAQNMTGEGNSFYGKTHTQESREKMSKGKRIHKDEFTARVLTRKDDLVCLTVYDEYTSRQNQYLDFLCVRCNQVVKKTLQAFERDSQCEYCFPNQRSYLERQVSDYVESLGVETIIKDRKILEGKEIDIYVPAENFAIEVNGLYWHSEHNKDYEPKSHRDKMLGCRDKGVQLMQIFSDHWANKNELVKSMIKSRLGKAVNKIGARGCIVKEISKDEADIFFNINHLSGSCRCRKAFGLVNENDQIVAALSLKIPLQKHKYPDSIEIARFAVQMDTSVAGGFQKLLSFAEKWILESGYKSILTYADLTVGAGKVYLRSGFEKIAENDGDYFYTDCVRRFNRSTCKARSGKPEKQVANESGLAKVHGAGNAIFLKKLL